MKISSSFLALALLSNVLFSFSSETKRPDVLSVKEAETGEGQSVSYYQLSISENEQQEIKGWGCFPYLYGNTMRFIEKSPLKNEIYNTLFRDLGMTHVRVKIDPDCGNADGSLNTSLMDKDVVSLLNNVKQYNLKWFLSTWSPPAFMKTTGIKNGFIDTNGNGKWDEGEIKSYLKVEYEDAFVDYYIKAIKYLVNTKGFSKPEYVSIQNELNYPVRWDGCEYSPGDYQRLIKKFRTRFDEEGLSDIKLHGPEANHHIGTLDFLGGVNFPALADDAELNRALSGIAFHNYGGYKLTNPGESNSYDKTTENLRKSMLLFPEKDVWMTEWCTSETPAVYYDLSKAKFLTRAVNTYQDGAVRCAQMLARSTVYVPCNYYNYWIGFSYHLDTNNWRQGLFFASNDMLVYNNIYNIHKIIYNNVLPGARVHRINSDDPELFTFNPTVVDAAAYVNEEHTTVLLVNQYDRTRSYSLNNIQAKKAVLHQLVNNDQIITSDLAVDNNSVKFELSPLSVNVIVFEHKSDGVEKAAENTIQEKKLNVFPTMTPGIINIEQEVKAISLYDLNGKNVGKWFNTDQIDISSKPSGNYLLHLKESDEKTMIYKIGKI